MSTQPIPGSAAPAPTAVAVKKSFFAKLWGDIVKGEHAVIAAVEKAASVAPEAVALAQQYGPEVSAILNTAVAGSGKYSTTAVNAVTSIGQVLEDGGAAAEQKFVAAGLDQTLITDVKGLWGNLKKAVPANAALPAAK